MLQNWGPKAVLDGIVENIGRQIAIVSLIFTESLISISHY